MPKKTVICSFCGNNYKPSISSNIHQRITYECGIGCSCSFTSGNVFITYKNVSEVVNSLSETDKISICFGYDSKYDMERYSIIDNTFFKLIKKPKFPNIKLYENTHEEISFNDLYIKLCDNCFDRYKDNYFKEYEDTD